MPARRTHARRSHLRDNEGRRNDGAHAGSGNFAREHKLKIVAIADLIDYRLQNESLIRRVAEATIPTSYGGEFKVIVYENDVDDFQHIALVKGEISKEDEVLVRVHSECLTGDVLPLPAATAAINCTVRWKW